MNNEKVALIFGGARGIGAAIAARLAREGYRIAVTWVSRPDLAETLVTSVKNAGGQALAIRADSADPADIQSAVDATLHHYGRLDIAVVNAGVLRLGRIEDFQLDDLDATLAVNVRGVFLSVQAAVKRMTDGEDNHHWQQYRSTHGTCGEQRIRHEQSGGGRNGAEPGAGSGIQTDNHQ
jgi:3-oxoacyl-[acyl-carrier protein] reductase